MREERVKKKRAMTHRKAVSPGASQPTLALGRQTSNCHVGQDFAEKAYFRLFLDDFFGDGAVLVSIFRKAAL
jgi:hypothetical protein